MLAVDCDQVQVELSGSLSLWVFKDDLEMGCFMISLKSDLIIVISELHDFSEICDGNTENHVSVSSVVLESVHGEVEGNEGNVG